jgi:3-deoxy-D-manno-octulosonic-acid transferase
VVTDPSGYYVRDSIEKLKANIPHPTVLFSQKESANLAEAKVLILDTIGLLSKIYKYAQVAYVGGGFGHPGVHNVLEPAVFGIPIVVGPNYQHFTEAVALLQAGGMYSISQVEELQNRLKEWEQNEKRELVGKQSFNFVHQQIGATKKIMEYFDT